jgi:amino acid permease
MDFIKDWYGDLIPGEDCAGTWWHAGFHLTTAIVGPTVLTLPYALRGMGWVLGLAMFTAVAVVTFYAYFLVSKVLDHCEAQGRRHIRFRELAADVLGTVNTAVVSPSSARGLIVLSFFGRVWVDLLPRRYRANCHQRRRHHGNHPDCRQCPAGTVPFLVFNPVYLFPTSHSRNLDLCTCLVHQIMYWSLIPDGRMKLYQFIIVVAVVLAFLSQLSSFHSLRHINLGSLILSFAYTILVSVACIRAGASSSGNADYSLSPSKSEKMFNAFLSIAILATVFGNGILPEIQATLATPAAEKMMKALVLCYAVVFFTFYLPAITGYWAFGNQVQSNVLESLMPDSGPSLAPTWLLGVVVVLVLLQLLAIALVIYIKPPPGRSYSAAGSDDHH